MHPGVTYTAPDGSTVMLQIVIEVADQTQFDPVRYGEIRFYQPDRPVDVRLLEQAPDGHRYTTRLRSPKADPNTLWTMYGDEGWHDSPPGMVDQHGNQQR